MNYYKILNEKENHNDLQYKTGLNVDPIPFNPYGDCKPGGIYFASRDIFAFLDYGPWIRKVTLPEDAQVYKNPNLPEKWKADKVILGKRRRITAEVIQKLIDEGADPKVNDSNGLRWAARNGHLDIVKVLIDKGAEPSAYNSHALQLAARNGHLEIVKLLIDNGADPTANCSCALRFAAENGHLEIVNLLLEHEADPKAINSYTLKWAARNGHLEIVKLLIDNGADPKANNSYALRWATANRHPEVVKLLIPVSDINKTVKEWIEDYCRDQEIKDLVLNYE